MFVFLLIVENQMLSMVLEECGMHTEVRIKNSNLIRVLINHEYNTGRPFQGFNSLRFQRKDQKFQQTAHKVVELLTNAILVCQDVRNLSFLGLSIIKNPKKQDVKIFGNVHEIATSSQVED